MQYSFTLGEGRLENPPNPNPPGRDTTKLRLSKEFPKPGKVNRMSKGGPRVYEQALMPGQTTTTGEGSYAGYMDQRYNSNWRVLYG